MARELVLAVYRLTEDLPPQERYLATSQLRRAAWSVQNNIAEGNAKRGRPELRRFLDISIGSLAEIDSMIDTLPRIYELDCATLRSVDSLRKRINAGIFRMLKGPGR